MKLKLFKTEYLYGELYISLNYDQISLELELEEPGFYANYDFKNLNSLYAYQNSRRSIHYGNYK